MPRTRLTFTDTERPLWELPASALRAIWKEGYTLQTLKADVLAGLVVGIVALPLSMALAIGVGVAPQHGLLFRIKRLW